MTQHTLNGVSDDSAAGYSFRVGRTPQGQHSAISSMGMVRFCFRADTKEEVLGKAQRAIALDKTCREEEQKKREDVARKLGTAGRSLSDLEPWSGEQELEGVELVQG